METTATVTAPSAPAAASATASPASSTSTAASAPSGQGASGSGAQSSTSSSTSSAPQSLEQALAAKIAAGFETGTESTASTDTATTEAEEISPGEPAVEAQAATTAETEAAPAAEESTGFDEFDSSDYSSVGPKDLAAKIDADPALKAAISANPEVRDLLFSNARLASKAKPYTDMFGSPEEAKAVVDGHQSFTNIRSLLSSVKRDDPQSTQSVITAMLEQDAMRDEDGNPMRDQNGNLITGGNTGRFLRNAFAMRLGAVEQQAKQTGDEEALAALDIVMERAGLRAPSSAAEDGMSEELKAQKAQIEQQQKALDDQREQSRREAQQQHEQRVYGRIDEALDKGISTILERASGLTPFTRQTVESRIRADLREAIKKNSAYQDELDQVERMPVGAKREAKHIALAQRYMQSMLARVARPILSEAGVTLQQSAQAKQQSQAARAEQTRSEVSGSAAPARQTAQPSAAQVNQQIRTDLTQKLGRAPTLEEMLAAKMAPAFQRQSA